MKQRGEWQDRGDKSGQVEEEGQVRKCIENLRNEEESEEQEREEGEIRKEAKRDGGGG